MSRERPFASRVVAGWVTDTGRVRDHNEDACFVDADRGLLVVSDGMGGHQAGALASQVVVKVLPEMIAQGVAAIGKASADAMRVCLREAIMKVSRTIREQSAGRIGLQGMGATVVLVLVRERFAYIAHMGDSRAYLLRDGRLDLLTDDHSVVGILLRHGDITPKQAREHPVRGELSRFVGMEGEVYPDVRTVAMKKGDRLLLCTDGLTGMLTEKRIASLLKAPRSAQDASRSLIDAANEAGGMDNITAVVADWA